MTVLPQFLFESPWLLLAALPAVAVALWVVFRTASPLPRLRQALGGAALIVAVVALLLMAAQVAWNEPSGRRTVWVLVDRSLSAGNAPERRLSGVLEELRNSLNPDDMVGVIGFSDRAEILLPPTAPSQLDASFVPPPANPSDETWLSAALELASRAAVPGTAPVALLLGDGHDSADRYGGDAVVEARDRAVPVFAMPVDSDPAPEAALADLSVRVAGRQPQIIAIDLVVQSTVAQYVVPTVRVNGEDVRERLRGERLDANGGIRVGAGRTPVQLMLEPREELPAYVVEVSLAAEQDTYPGNGTAKLSVRGDGTARVLLLHAGGKPEKALQRALERAGMRVTAGPSTLLPSELIELQRYQVVLLCDVPAMEFADTQQRLLERFVREGGGLAMIGGPDSYAPGGWFETRVEAVLPVTCDVIEKGRKQTPAMVIALDKSGSMGAEVGGYTKMELANEGATRTIKLLPPNSLFGMVSVNTEADWVVAFAELKDRQQATVRARTNRHGGGGIFVDVAIRESLDALLSAEASSRHLVLFSDGSDTEFSTFGLGPDAVLEMVRDANQKHGLTVTTICLGNGKDRAFLEDLAIAGNGRALFVDNAATLPAVFSREAAVSAGTFIREDPFRPWVGMPGRLTEGVAFEAETTPPLLGYVGATARKEANVWLWTNEDKERPLLATWHVELGKALAFTSDARDRWADRWMGWESYDELWQRWVTWLLPEPERIAGVESEWTLTREGPALQLSFYDELGNARELASPLADVTLPDGSTQSARVLPGGLGEYRVQFPRAGSGVYSVVVHETLPNGEERAAAREHRIFVPIDELTRRGANTPALAAIGQATGGKIVTSAGEVAAAAVTGGYSTIRPRTWLLAIALGALILGIGARRFPSVWRTRPEKSRRTEPVPGLSAADAYDRVRKKLHNRNSPRATAPQPRGSIAPPAPREEPAPAAAPAQGSVLSAMRKVRKDREGRDRS
jgi:uncharacterized membrane protein